MTAPAAIKAAMSVAKDLAEGRVAAGQLDALAVEECRVLVGRVVGPGDALWELHVDVARQVLAAGGVPSVELAEWLAVTRAAEGVDVVAAGSWIEAALAELAEDDDLVDEPVANLKQSDAHAVGAVEH